MADIERFGAASEAAESEREELERLEWEQERDLYIARSTFNRAIDFTEPAPTEAPPVAEPVQPPPQVPPPETVPVKKTNRLERIAKKALPKTGAKRLEQGRQIMETIAGTAKSAKERAKYALGKGPAPESLRARQEAKQAKPTTAEARDESFGRLDSMRSYVEDLAERKPENLERMDKVYDLLLKTRNTKFDKWKELAGIGLSLATIVALPLGGSASALTRIGRMAFGSFNYSTIGFRMGSEFGLRDEIKWAEERYEALVKMPPDNQSLNALKNILGEQLALYRAGVRYDQYESNRQGLKLFGRAGEVFQAFKQGKIYESGKTFWSAVAEDRKELLKLGGKMAFYSTPLIAAALAPGLALPLYAGTTGANMIERIMRYRKLGAKEQFEKSPKEPDPLLKRIMNLADRYDQQFSLQTAAWKHPEEIPEVIAHAQSVLRDYSDENYSYALKSRAVKGLGVGAILGAISASFYGIMSHRSPAAAHEHVPAKASGAAGAAGAATEHARGTGKSALDHGPSKSGDGAAAAIESQKEPEGGGTAGEKTLGGAAGQSGGEAPPPAEKTPDGPATFKGGAPSLQHKPGAPPPELGGRRTSGINTPEFSAAAPDAVAEHGFGNVYELGGKKFINIDIDGSGTVGQAEQCEVIDGEHYKLLYADLNGDGKAEKLPEGHYLKVGIKNHLGYEYDAAGNQVSKEVWNVADKDDYMRRVAGTENWDKVRQEHAANSVKVGDHYETKGWGTVARRGMMVDLNALEGNPDPSIIDKIPELQARLVNGELVASFHGVELHFQGQALQNLDSLTGGDINRSVLEQSAFRFDPASIRLHHLEFPKGMSVEQLANQMLERRSELPPSLRGLFEAANPNHPIAGDTNRIALIRMLGSANQSEGGVNRINLDRLADIRANHAVEIRKDGVNYLVLEGARIREANLTVDHDMIVNGKGKAVPFESLQKTPGQDRA